MAARRVLSVSLPAGDSHTATILAWLEGQPEGADVSREARRLLALALSQDSRLAAIEGKLDRLLASGLSAVGVVAELDKEQDAALDAMFNFG